MQAVILCGGMGTRIRDVADDVPKPMIPVGGEPLLWHIMRGYARHGVTDFILCLGYKGWAIKRWFLDYRLAHSDFTLRLGDSDGAEIHRGAGAADGWRVTFAETGLETMTGGRIKRIERYVRGDTFMVTYGDGVADVDITASLAFHRAHGRLGTATSVRPPGRFGELDLEGTRVVEFCEKPLVAPGWINGGFFVFNRGLFDRLEDDPGLVFEREPLMGLARDGELMAFKHTGFWHPMDSSRDHKYLNDLYSSGQAPWITWEISETAPRQRLAA